MAFLTSDIQIEIFPEEMFHITAHTGRVRQKWVGISQAEVYEKVEKSVI